MKYQQCEGIYNTGLICPTVLIRHLYIRVMKMRSNMKNTAHAICNESSQRI